MTCVLLTVIFSCRKTDTPLRSTLPGGDQATSVIPKARINAFIKAAVQHDGAFKWQTASDSIAWSALVQGDSVLSVGYQPQGFTGLDKKIHAIDLHSTEWKAAKAQVLLLILENEKKAGAVVTEKDIVVADDGKLPVINVKASRFSTVNALRRSPLVRYAEPIGYGAFMEEGPATFARANSSILAFGCGSNAANTSLVAGVDYTNITPGAKQSWNLSYHKIPQAWTRSTGSGVKVMIIDTGVSPDQPNLGSLFNQGASSGRTIEKLVTFSGATPADECGHGTRMAGVLAAPRGINGNGAGIAYNASLVTVHAAENVVILSTSAVQGVTAAYTLGADNPAVKIISMSMGTIFDFGQIEDAIKYAYNKQKLMFCAAGTTNSFFTGFVGVIFPASLPQVQAVTGIKDNLTTACVDCHTGAEVDFVIVMEKVSTGKNPLTSAMSGDAPSTVGGSSVATASCAGIAALVWSKHPSDTRDAIIERLRAASSFANNKHSKFGWGIIDANAAVGQ